MTEIGLIGTYVPRLCGIATFTHDLATSLASDGAAIRVAALDDGQGLLDYPAEVQHRVRKEVQGDYVRVGRALSDGTLDALSLQHEFGIFGGEDGAFVLDLLDSVTVPIVTTFHTLLPRPSSGQTRVLEGIARRSDALVVMSERGAGLLADQGIRARRVELIPHGVPDLGFPDPDGRKPGLGLTGHRVVLSFGLIGPNKGYEMVLDALPAIVRRVPNVVYVIVGATHPELKRTEGERYRASLIEAAARGGARDHVMFVDRYVSTAELGRWLQAADVFVTPYPNPEQIVSGTLSYAMAAGAAIVSTPYEYARELLADGRGILTPFGDPAALADNLIRVLEDPALRNGLRRAGYRHARGMIWPAVGAAYRSILLDVAHQAGRAGQAERVRPTATAALIPYPARSWARAALVVPEAHREHLDELSNHIGVFQHAVGRRPDPRHGYCTDDMARAFTVDVLHGRAAPSARITSSLDRSLGFLESAFVPAHGRFRNFRLTSGEWTERIGSQDAHGRVVRSLGESASMLDDGLLFRRAARLFDGALRVADELDSLRPTAYVALGCAAALDWTDDERVWRTLRRAADRLGNASAAALRSDPSWPWPEDIVTYESAVLPHALLRAGQRLDADTLIERGLELLGWLLAAQATAWGTLSFIGNRGWWRRGRRPAQFDQQPIDATALLEAALAAADLVAGTSWTTVAERAFQWFLGANDRWLILSEADRGGCRDGVGDGHVNVNQGAESTLCWLLAVERMRTWRDRPRATRSTPSAAGWEVLLADR